MKSYTNKTRYAAIITISIESTENPQAALELGADDVYEALAAKVGHYDILVEPGKELRAAANTAITFLGARSAP